MSKKIMLLALAVTSVAMVALPVAASAQEIHLEGITSFSGTAGASSFAPEGEPTITCESTDLSGTVSAGGTTGELSVDVTGCHTTVFGFTAKCRTTGSPLDNTMKSSAAFHLITLGSGTPGILITPVVTTYVCAGITNMITGGNIIGTITSPACGAENKEMTTNFAATGAVQEHSTYTGTTLNLTAKTGEGGTVKKAGLVSTARVQSATTGKLNCT
jgi:hypothetical protein